MASAKTTPNTIKSGSPNLDKRARVTPKTIGAREEIILVVKYILNLCDAFLKRRSKR